MTIINPTSITSSVEELSKNNSYFFCESKDLISYMENSLIPSLKEGDSDIQSALILGYRIAFQEYKSMVEISDEDLINKITNTLIKKNMDYGNSFEEGYKDLGMSNIIVPLYNKMKRLNSLGKKNFESMEDTILDILGYIILSYICVTTLGIIN